MPRGKFYEKFEIPAGSSGVATTVHVHYDNERREYWRDLMERARRRPLKQRFRDAEPQLPERVSHEEIQRDARRRTYGSRRRDAESEQVFHYDSNGWHERPHARDRHADALRQFRDALRKFYDQNGPEAEFLAWVASHMDPGDWGKPKPDPNRMNTESVLKYNWPNPKRFAEGFDFKTSGGKSGSERMTAGSGGFRDSRKPKTVADLNKLHREHYRGRVL